MPLWQIYYPEGTFDDEAAQQALAKDITALYTGVGLPAFYVAIQFIHVPAARTFMGEQRLGQGRKPFIRLVIAQIAINHAKDDHAAYTNNRILIDRALKPHIADKGYDWEYHVDETDRRLWKVNGMNAPLHNTEDEKVWVKENKPVAWSGAFDE